MKPSKRILKPVVYLTKACHKRLKRLAFMDRRSMGDVVEAMVSQKVQRKTKKAAK